MSVDTCYCISEVDVVSSDLVATVCVLVDVLSAVLGNSLAAPPLPSAPPLRLPSQTEQIQSPQEVTVEGDRQPSVLVIVTTKNIMARKAAVN